MVYFLSSVDFFWVLLWQILTQTYLFDKLYYWIWQNCCWGFEHATREATYIISSCPSPPPSSSLYNQKKLFTYFCDPFIIINWHSKKQFLLRRNIQQMNEYSSIMRAFSLQMLNEDNIGILFLAHLQELTPKSSARKLLFSVSFTNENGKAN